ncbi:hypothetical protein ACP4TB_03255 [Streptomyces sp. DR3-1]|uniref:hypothetical protein n=1 Tax=Streptomyces sp. DR3-1 TaxID=2951169 RepID=UPI002042E79F|nr:hypothetical protein [Streptomyces sp. DR3-1]MCM3817294.1 hypothetical protein [Streptomyces sp. DR3-1]
MDHGLPGDRTGALERGRAVGDVGGAQFPGAPPQQAAQLLDALAAQVARVLGGRG